MLNLVREGEEDYIEAIRYRRRLKIFENFLSAFKIEKIKLPLTMPHPQADLLPQMPHPGEDKVVKCPTNAPGGGGGGCVRFE